MIDLHCHSVCSDGTLTPEELSAQGRGFYAFALTDHDNCDGCARFLEASKNHAGIRLAGIELSIEPGEGYSKFHLLGLGIDPGSDALNAFLEKIRLGRNRRNEKIMEKLKLNGFDITWDEVVRHSGGNVVAKPHFARAMMARGLVGSVAEAFDKYLADGRACNVPRFHPPQKEAIDVIHAAHGVAVMAHPKYWTQDFARLRSGLAELKAMGLDGLEAMYQANEPGETVEHLRIAAELDLAVTAGSDFHGANKPTVKLGMSPVDDAAFLAPILSRIN